MSVEVLLGSNIQEQAVSLIERAVEAKVASRIAAKDSSVWGAAAQPEASIRLGWVTSALDSAPLVAEIMSLKSELASKGIDRFVLCGMGGSSLAPEVITGAAKVELVTLDSTDPAQVQAATIDLQRTAVIVSSKSGSTVETDSQKRHFEAAFREVGIDPIERIVVVTDPGSPLDNAAREAGFRVFNADPNVGGRYSALTAFGLVPSGLAGADISALLEQAEGLSQSLAQDSNDNPAIKLAAAIAAEGPSGVRNKFALLSPNTAPGLGDWVEQLVAESTGKAGRGRLPVVLGNNAPELTAGPSDLLVVGSDPKKLTPDQIVVFGALGELFIVWEFATAILGFLLEINPFDQPDVESAKVAARALLDAPKSAPSVDFVSDGIGLSARNLPGATGSVEQALMALCAKTVIDSNYLSIHAYLSRPGYPQYESLRDQFAEVTGRPVTFGWGPRFLHSTGQYHKGGPRQGVFLQIIGESEFDLQVPERPFTFGSLISAQAAGDANVLAEHGDSVLTLRTSDPLALLQLIEEALKR